MAGLAVNDLNPDEWRELNSVMEHNNAGIQKTIITIISVYW